MTSPLRRLIGATVVALLLSACGDAPPAPQLSLTSPAFDDSQPIPREFTCDGRNVSPPLAIANVPDDAKRLALIALDRDAADGTFAHWVVWNIDPATARIEIGKAPEGATEGKTTFGRMGYGGPCPPKGTHRYVFTLYAVDRPLTLPSLTTAEALQKAMSGSVLATSTLVGTYTRDRE